MNCISSLPPSCPTTMPDLRGGLQPRGDREAGSVTG
jgi:hypothetical protein